MSEERDLLMYDLGFLGGVKVLGARRCAACLGTMVARLIL
jgi:hypothetical protein